MTAEALGLDVNGVIIARDEKQPLTLLPREDYLNSPPLSEDTFHVLRRMTNERFGDRVYVICIANSRTLEKTAAWFNHYSGFYGTGIKPENLIFCDSWEKKKELCKKLGITHFVDGSLAATEHLKEVVPKLFILNYSKAEPDPSSLLMAKSNLRWHWSSIESELLLPGLPMQRRGSPYGYDEFLKNHGNGTNLLRTSRVVQPAALEVGDVLATGETILSPPRQGGNGGVMIHLSGRKDGSWIEVASRLPLALLTKEDNTPPGLLERFQEA